MFRMLSSVLLVLGLTGCAASYDQGTLTLRQRAADAPVPVSDTVEIGLIALNDFHGTLEPPRRAIAVRGPHGETLSVPAGGAAWLASAVDALRARHEYSLTVAAGDMTGGSQLASDLFLDEPSVGVLNRIGLDLTSVGNHEFDRGARELLRLKNGGCEKFAKREPCAVEPDFAGAKYTYLAANVLTADGTTLLPPTALRTVGEGKRQVTLGFIGLTLEGTPLASYPENMRGLTFLDEAEVINRRAAELEALGADVIVVLIHEGLVPANQDDPDSCPGSDGALAGIVGRLDRRVALVVSGHTHMAYVCELPGLEGAGPILVTSAGSQGTLLTDITLMVDPLSGQLVSRSARNVPVQSEPFGDTALSEAAPRFMPREDVARYVALYTDAAARYSQRAVGRLAGPARTEPARGDSGPLGNLIADAMLAAGHEDGAQIALMNPGGIRAPLVPGEGGTVSFGDLFSVNPFGHTLVTLTLNGAEIRALLESQFDGIGPNVPLAVSDGFAFAYDLSRPVGQRISQVTLDGKPLRPESDYRIATNSYLAEGGNGFTMFAQARDKVVGPGDLDALEAWLQADPPRAAPTEIRTRNLTPAQ